MQFRYYYDHKNTEFLEKCTKNWMTHVAISTPPLLQEYGMRKDWFDTH